MNGYIFTLVALGLLSAAGSALAHAEMRAPTRAALGILVLAAVAAPIGSLAGSIADGLESLPTVDAEQPAAVYENALADAFSDGVAAAAAQRLGLADGVVTAECEGFVPKECRAMLVRLRIEAELTSDTVEQLRKYISEDFTNGGRCEVELV